MKRKVKKTSYKYILPNILKRRTLDSCKLENETNAVLDKASATDSPLACGVYQIDGIETVLVCEWETFCHKRFANERMKLFF